MMVEVECGGGWKEKLKHHSHEAARGNFQSEATKFFEKGLIWWEPSFNFVSSHLHLNYIHSRRQEQLTLFINQSLQNNKDGT